VSRIQLAEYSDREMSIWHLEDNSSRYNLVFNKAARTWTLARLLDDLGDSQEVVGVYDKAPADLLKRCNIGKLIG
jgi:hypothetical protein